MKSNTLKGFLMGTVTTILLIVLTVSVFAAGSVEKKINVTYGGITIMLDGKKIEPKDANGNPVEAMIYNGTTYLPVRAVGSAFGKEVDWDEKTTTVYLGAQPSSTKYSRTNPAPIGATQSIAVKNYSDDFSVNISITEVYRGAEAWTMVQNANIFNNAPAAGKEYIVAKVKSTVTSVANDKAASFSTYDFTAFSGTNAEYPYDLTVAPSPQFNGKVYAGGSLEGYTVFLVDKSDATPKAVYGENYDGSGGIWFKLYK